MKKPNKSTNSTALDESNELTDDELEAVEGGVARAEQVSVRHDTAKAVIGKNTKEFTQSGGDPNI